MVKPCVGLTTKITNLAGRWLINLCEAFFKPGEVVYIHFITFKDFLHRSAQLNRIKLVL